MLKTVRFLCLNKIHIYIYIEFLKVQKGDTDINEVGILLSLNLLNLRHFTSFQYVFFIRFDSIQDDPI